MNEHAAFLAEVNAFLVENGMAATAFGRAAVNDGHFVRRLREHRGITLATVGRVRDFMASRRDKGSSQTGSAEMVNPSRDSAAA